MHTLKLFFLFLGDVIALYAALFITLLLRYGAGFYQQFVDAHATPFTIIFVIWLVIFYIAGLYDLRRLRNNIEFLKILATAIAASALIAMLLFYLVPVFGITPKTNLLIFFVVFAVIEIGWRRSFNRLAGTGDAPNRILFVTDGALANEIEQAIGENPQLGYAIVAKINAEEAGADPSRIESTALATRANLVVVPRHLKRNSALAATLYRLFGQGTVVTDLATFYELILRKIPLADLEETWFLENIESVARFYDPLKRALELILAIAMGIIFLPFAAVFAIIIKLTSPGPVIYQQKRVGLHGRTFMLYKFRSMRNDAEKNGPQWAAGFADPRITPFGKFLRLTHLDEFSQLWNIIRGDVSFVGPRPERPEIVEVLKKQIPYYEVRLLVKPGASGWAGLNHRADQSLDDVRQKLQYDIYYLKNRSLILDCAIILKTVKSIFVNPK